MQGGEVQELVITGLPACNNLSTSADQCSLRGTTMSGVLGESRHPVQARQERSRPGEVAVLTRLA
jgi:hypothetical protein